MNSVMPYLVLNKAACDLFSDGSQSLFSDKKTDIGFLTQTFLLRLGGQSVSCKFSGILSNKDDDAPIVYMDIRAAQNLLRADNRSPDPTEAYVRLANSGYAKSVSDALTDLGYDVLDTNADLQTDWDKKMLQETGFWILAGFFSPVLYGRAAVVARSGESG